MDVRMDERDWLDDFHEELGLLGTDDAIPRTIAGHIYVEERDGAGRSWRVDIPRGDQEGWHERAPTVVVADYGRDTILMQVPSAAPEDAAVSLAIFRTTAEMHEYPGRSILLKKRRPVHLMPSAAAKALGVRVRDIYDLAKRGDLAVVRDIESSRLKIPRMSVTALKQRRELGCVAPIETRRHDYVLKKDIDEVSWVNRDTRHLKIRELASTLGLDVEEAKDLIERANSADKYGTLAKMTCTRTADGVSIWFVSEAALPIYRGLLNSSR